MSGHSKWSTIKRQKGAADIKRGQQFSKLSKAVTLAAKQGGGDPDGNPRLKVAIEAARAANMPKDNISRAIEKATAAGAANLESVMYEGYGPGGAALLVEAVTDNRNRTVAEVRSVFNKHGGTMSEAGSVSWMFQQQAIITVPVTEAQAEEASMVAIEAGASDLDIEDGSMTVMAELTSLHQIVTALSSYGEASSDLQMVPANDLELDQESWTKLERIIEALEDLEDVDRVHTNAHQP